MDTTAEEELLASFIPDGDGSFHMPRIRDYMSGTDAPSDFLRTNLPEIRSYLSENTTPNMSTDVAMGYSTKPLKEISEELKTLRIENFDLKLSIFFMQRKYQGYSDHGKENIIKLNIDMKTEIKNLKSSLSVKEHLLQDATRAMEEESEAHSQDLARVREEVGADLRFQIHEAEQQVAQMRDEIDATCQTKDNEILKLKEQQKTLEEGAMKRDKAIEALIREIKKYRDGEKTAESFSELSPRPGELQDLRDCLDEKEDQLQEYMAQLHQQEMKTGDLEALNSSLRRKLKEKSAEVSLHSSRGQDDAEQEMELLRQTLREREDDIERANQMLLTTEETINILEAEAKEKDEKSQQLEADLDRTRDALESARQDSQDKAKKLQQVATSLKSSQQALEDARQQHQEDITGREVTIRQLRDELELKDATHHVALRQNAITMERQLLELQAKLQEEESKSSHQRDSFEKALAALIASVKAKDQEITKLSEELENDSPDAVPVRSGVETSSVGCQVRMRDHPAQAGTINGTLAPNTSALNEDLRQQVAALEKEVGEARRHRSPMRAQHANPAVAEVMEPERRPRRITVSPVREQSRGDNPDLLRSPVLTPAMKFLSVQARTRGESPPPGDISYNASNSFLPSFYRLPSHEVDSLLPDEDTLGHMSHGELLKVIQDIRSELLSACSDNLELARELQEKKDSPQQSQNVRIHLANLNKDLEAMKRERDRLADQLLTSHNSHRSEIQFVPGRQSDPGTNHRNSGVNGGLSMGMGDRSGHYGGARLANGKMSGPRADTIVSELQEAKAQVQQLESKLLATEATVRCQTDKMKSYRSLLEEAGLVSPRSPPRSRSESNLVSAVAAEGAAEALQAGAHKSGSLGMMDGAVKSDGVTPRRPRSAIDFTRFDSSERLNASLERSRFDGKDVCTALMHRLDEIGDLMSKLLNNEGDLDKEDVIDRTLERVSQLKDKLRSARGLADSLGGMIEAPEGMFNDSLRSVPTAEFNQSSHKPLAELEDKYEDAVHEIERLRGEVERYQRAASMSGDMEAANAAMGSLHNRLKHAQDKQHNLSLLNATPPHPEQPSIERGRHATGGSNPPGNNLLHTLNSSLHSDKMSNHSSGNEADDLRSCFGQFLKGSPNSSVVSGEGEKRLNVDGVDAGPLDATRDADWSYLDDVGDYQREIVTLRTRLNTADNVNQSLRAELNVYDTIHNQSVGIQSSPMVSHDASQAGDETTFLSLEEHLREIRLLREKLVDSQSETEKLQNELKHQLSVARDGSVTRVRMEFQKEVELLNREMSTLTKDLKNAKKAEDNLRGEKEEVDNALNKALLEIKRLQDEKKRIKDQMTEDQQLNRTLKMELSVYDQLDFDQTDSAKKVKRRSGSDSKDSIDVLLLQAMRQLRKQLEHTIESERKLREQLVAFMKSGALDPTVHTVDIARREFVSIANSHDREIVTKVTDTEKENEELRRSLKKSRGRVAYLERQFENAIELVKRAGLEQREMREERRTAAHQRGHKLFKSIEDQLLQHLDVIHHAESNLKQCHQRYPTTASSHTRRDSPPSRH